MEKSESISHSLSKLSCSFSSLFFPLGFFQPSFKLSSAQDCSDSRIPELEGTLEMI